MTPDVPLRERTGDASLSGDSPPPRGAAPSPADGPTLARRKILELKRNLAAVIHGKTEQIETLVIALLAGGSVLMEDVPGVGKTTLAKALARSLDVEFRRVQFTPDLLPSDILGASVYNPQEGTFTFREGPIFCSVLLADEINRASPRTQSALLEAMSEGQATIEGHRYYLPRPFIVLATENPIDFHGTYPLPEAQLDRFLVQLRLGYPDADTEVGMLLSQATQVPVDRLQPVLRLEEVLCIQSMVREIYVDRSIARYIVQIVQATRQHHQLKLGVSPRGSLMFFRAVQASAFADGRDHVLPDDVHRLAIPVLAHRTVLTSKAKYGNLTKEQVIEEILTQVPLPV